MTDEALKARAGELVDPDREWDDAKTFAHHYLQERHRRITITARLAEVEAGRDQLKLAAEDARMGHVRLDECGYPGKPPAGPLYDRISWKIQQLAYEVGEHRCLRQAEEARADILAKQVVVAERERDAAGYHRRLTESSTPPTSPQADHGKVPQCSVCGTTCDVCLGDCS